MMDENLFTAFGKGYERMAAWSDLLDDINLFPVADADTGRNLRISLTPLKFIQTQQDISRRLLMSAVGNSGNIAAAFFSKFIRMKTCNNILDAAAAGKDAAWSAIQNPQNGTMLNVFATLVNALNACDIQQMLSTPDLIQEQMKISVMSTADFLPEHQQAGVVDSGALGMFFFFEGFFISLANQPGLLSNPYALFGDKLKLSISAKTENDKGYCIDTVVIPSAEMQDVAVDKLSEIGEHVVAVSDGDQLKVHLHAPDASSVRKDIGDIGQLLHWKSEKIEHSKYPDDAPAGHTQKVHVVTDAAGSLTREAARQLGLTLLDSYIIIGDQHLPESMVTGQMLYEAMSKGVKVTTAQASNFERYQHYTYLTQRFSKVLYLCVGSVYTGNFRAADQWKSQNPSGKKMLVVDTGAASGRLGLIARHVAKHASFGNDLGKVAQYAENLCIQCDELVFLNQLKYLAAGGRISKSKGFFGDLFKIKPIIRPGSQGAEKVGTVKNEEQQVTFLINHLGECLDSDFTVDILLQYTDNQSRIMSQIKPRIQALLPNAHICVHPMSMTSGAHMGPGTWSVAYTKS